jgi:capsular polysaccharide biosynthesis protein/Mrp family chromosome partitioning ATPase
MSIDASSAALVPSRAEGGLGPYVRAVRTHPRLILFCGLLAALASIAWVTQRSPSYRATAQILVAPISQDDQTYLGIQVVRDSPGDPTRTVQTAATLIDTRAAARLAAANLGNGWTTGAVDGAVSVEPQGQSNVVAVTGEASSGRDAARLANAFARAALADRNAVVRRQVAAALASLQARTAGASDAQASALADRRTALEAAEGRDPTLSLAQTASVPGSATGAPKELVVVLALIAGLTLGTGIALALGAIDPRIQDERELLSFYTLPTLAHVPEVAPAAVAASNGSRSTQGAAIAPELQRLVDQIDRRRGGSGTVMVTSASSRDGKTAAADGLAAGLAAAGRRVILVDFDLRGMAPDGAAGVAELAAPGARLEDLLAELPGRPGVRALPAGGGVREASLVEAVNRRLPEITAAAEGLADYVVFDTAPLGEVPDALALAAQVDELIVVVRPGHTDRAGSEHMRDLLRWAGRLPTGLVVMGAGTGGPLPDADTGRRRARRTATRG